MLPLFPKSITLLELLNPDGCRHIRQIILVARREDLVIPGTLGGVAFPGILADSMEAHDPHPLCPFWIVGRDHAALASCDRLGSIKGKAGDIANRSHHPSLKTGGKG